MHFWTSFGSYEQVNFYIVWVTASAGVMAAAFTVCNLYSAKRLFKHLSTAFTVLTAILTCVTVYSNNHLSKLQNDKQIIQTTRMSNLSSSIVNSNKKIFTTQIFALDSKFEGIKTKDELANEKLKLAKTQNEVAEANKKQIEAERSLGQVQEKIRFRSINSQQRVELVKLLKLNVRPPIIIGTPAGVPESMQFALQLNDILKEAGWDAKGVGQDFYVGGHPVGILIEVHSYKEAPRYAAFLQHALKQVGIESMGTENPDTPNNYVKLIVGLKPNPN
jgi:hypothetical protein